MNFLSIDVGTTMCKCQLFSESGEILDYIAEEYPFLIKDGESYVNVDLLWKKLCSMIARVAKKYEISSVAVSSLGESFVLLDGADEVLFYPMLYTDRRGEAEAVEIREKIGDARLKKITGVAAHSMYSLSKLLMIKNKYPELFARADKALLICDYVGYLLSGKRVIDYGLAARTGAFDVERCVFSEEVLSPFGIRAELFSVPKRAGHVVAHLKKSLCAELGIKGSPLLVLGSHDQICSSLGAGALSAGDAVDGMGTVECITAIFDEIPTAEKMRDEGYPIVPYVKEGLYCTYMLSFSCGSLVNWLRKDIIHGYSGDAPDFFTYAEGKMKDGPSGILTLPYFAGASTPYQDAEAKGAVVGLGLDTTDAELYKSVLEATAMEMRLNAETVREYGIVPKRAVATGGGANSARWLQIKADVQGLPFRTLRSSEGGLCGCAMLQAAALGAVEDLFAAKDVFVRYEKEFLPTPEGASAYEPYYEKYKKLYKTIKELTK